MKSYLSILSVILSPLFIVGILWNVGMIGIGDWDYHQSWALAARKSIVEYGQLPMWNPWHCGGMDFLENPLARVYSPSL